MRRKRRVLAALSILMALSGIAAGLLALRSLVTALAVSTAKDLIVQSVSAITRDCMSEGFGDGLVSLGRNAFGEVASVETNVAAVNVLAAEVLERTVEATADNDLRLSVPVGSILGSPVLSVPVSVKMLSSSASSFRSELQSEGINQTRHRILLELTVEASLFMPWRIVDIAAETDILISETVIVGEVPESYWTPPLPFAAE